MFDIRADRPAADFLVSRDVPYLFVRLCLVGDYDGK